MAKRKLSAAPGITSPLGFRAAGATCGIKVSGKPDLAIIAADGPCAAAGVFTTNRVPSSSVIVGKHHLRSGFLRAIVCNSGNANSSTGALGLANARRMCGLLAKHLGCKTTEVMPGSTGIIGHQLPMDKIAGGIDAAVGRLARGPGADEAAARGIMTTDLTPKAAGRVIRLGGRRVVLAGICKGSGMIAPNLATMLVYLTTDAAISPAMLRAALAGAAAESFNRISVDQHTSPSDTVLILASGGAGNRVITGRGAAYEAFAAGLTDLCRDLAYQIVKDGEGATRVFRVRVRRARTVRDADLVGRAIINSPLVKTAVHGGDPNWGRITTAAGYSGAAVNPQSMTLSIGAPGGVCVYRRGQPTILDAKALGRLGRFMTAKEVVFTLDLGQGRHEVEWLGCDLSQLYIAINADYTT